MISTILVIAKLFGGLALFVFGMQAMSKALQQSAGRRLRGLLQRSTDSRPRGFAAGTALSVLVHSSATTVMIVGFMSAGLLSLTRSIPVILGANFGTTLSMQIIAFKVGKLAFLAIAIGFLINQLARRQNLALAGMVLFGFGLLFLGMETMSDSIRPIKDGATFRTVADFATGNTFLGFLTGFLIAVAFTAIVQSSGATVAICFTLCNEGVFPDLVAVFPYLLGAHVGTCITAFLGSIGANRRAKRAAIAHLMFNLFSTALAAAMLPLYLKLIPLTADGLVRQAANANSVVQLIAALAILPAVKPYVRLVKKVKHFKKDRWQKSFLEPATLETPEMALVLVTKEIRRAARITRSMLRSAMEALAAQDQAPLRSLAQSRQAMDTLKLSVDDYLMRIAERELSRRQAILVQYLTASISDLERVADHSEAFAATTSSKTRRNIWFQDEDFEELVLLFGHVDSMFGEIIRSLKPGSDDRPKKEHEAREVNALRDEYFRESTRVREAFKQNVLAKEIGPLTGIYFSRFLNILDRIVRHTRSIARLELEPLFFIKEGKLERSAPPAPPPEPIQDRIPYGEGLGLKELIKTARRERAARGRSERHTSDDLDQSLEVSVEAETDSDIASGLNPPDPDAP